MSTGNAFGQQMPVAPAPIQPQPAGKMSGGLKGCLIAGAVIVVAGIILVAGGWFVVNKSGPIFAEILIKAKPEYMAMLTPEHTPEQKAAVEKAYDQMTFEIREKGMVKGITEHEKSFRLLQAYTADKKVDVEESTSWLQEWEKEEQQIQGQK